MGELRLPEELLLLAYDGVKGRPVVEQNRLDHGLAGALASELVLARRIEVGDRQLTVISDEPTGDPLADAALSRVSADPGAHRPPGWLSRLRVELREQVLARLVREGVLRRDEHRRLGLFARTVYPTANPQPEADLRQRLKAVLDQRQAAEPRTAALVALALACDMGDRLTSSDGEQVRARMEQVAGDDPVGPVVRAAINAVDDALMAAAGRHPRPHRR